VDLDSGETRAFIGSGRGNRDGDFKTAQFYEPGGLSIAGDRLFIADTNNQIIRIANLKTGQVSTLALTNLPRPLPAEVVRSSAPQGGVITASTVQVAPNTSGTLVLNVALPQGFHLTVDAPQSVQARVEGNGVKLATKSLKDKSVKLPIQMNFASMSRGKGTFVVSANLNYCADDNGICKINALRLRVPFEVTARGSASVSAAVKLP
jgi:hypothetical protein